MIISYPFEGSDFERQKNEILDVKSENAKLEICFINYLKIYGSIFGILLLIILFTLKDSQIFFMLALISIIMCIITIAVLYFFQFYKIQYDNINQNLIIKKWYGSINIPKSKLIKVYIKSKHYPRGGSGTNLYIGYFNDKNKEKYILLDIFTLKLDAVKKFIDIFII